MLHGHSQNIVVAMPLIRRMRPALWKAIDPFTNAVAQDSPGGLSVGDELVSLGVKLVVRHYGPWDGDFNAWDVAAWVADCEQQPWWPYAWAVETPNEPHQGDPDRMALAVELLKQRGKECVVGNWGTGWDGFYVPGADIYSRHAYGWPTVESHGDPQAIITWFESQILPRNPQAQLLLTEVGITRLKIGEHTGEPEGVTCGWQTGADGLTYWNSLVQMDTLLSSKPYYLGAAIYEVGANLDWWTFEHLGTEFEDWLVGQPRSTVSVPQEEELSMPTARQQLILDVLHGIPNELEGLTPQGEKPAKKVILTAAKKRSLAKQLRDIYGMAQEEFNPKA